MSIVRALDQMIDELNEKKTPPENIIMGRTYFEKWIVEISHDQNISMEPGKKRYKFHHRDIPVILCDSEILEVVPNAKFLLGE